MSLSRKLRSAREHAGLSQGQVAKLLGLHRPTISEIEAGRRKVGSEELKEFARIYEVSVSWLMDIETDTEFEDKVRLAARDLAKLDPEDLDKLMRLLASLKESEG